MYPSLSRLQPSAVTMAGSPRERGAGLCGNTSKLQDLGPGYSSAASPEAAKAGQGGPGALGSFPSCPQSLGGQRGSPG